MEHVRILTPDDQPRILEYALARLKFEIEDENERTFAAWKAPWRVESLEHYLKLGWSFGVFNKRTATDDQFDQMPLLGFSLIQPLLFFRSQTQSLWVEHIQTDADISFHLLIDYAVKMGRDKHIQRVLFREGETVLPFVRSQTYGATAAQLLDGALEVRTTKG